MSQHTDLQLRATVTPTLHSFDWPCAVMRFAYWGTMLGLVLLLLFLYITAGSRPSRLGEISDGTATINRIGVVTNWTDRAEMVTGVERRKMIGNDVFNVLPPEWRDEIRRRFEMSLADDKLYPWPRVSYGKVQMTFRYEGGPSIEAVFSR